MDFEPMRKLMDRLTDWRIPGNGAVVYVDGKEAFSYQSGYADAENKAPFTCDHMINLYSFCLECPSYHNCPMAINRILFRTH